MILIQFDTYRSALRRWL